MPPRSTPATRILPSRLSEETGFPTRCGGISTRIRNRSPAARVSLISSPGCVSMRIICFTPHRVVETVGMFRRS